MNASAPKSPKAATPDDDGRTTAIGLARFGLDYLNAALVVDEHMGKGPECSRISPVPAYFLLTHAIELTLKAYLRHMGVSVKQLSSKEFGHDLKASYAKAQELGLDELFTANGNDKLALDLLVHINEGHQLRYICTGAKEFPSWTIAEPFAVRLHQAISPHVGYKSLDVAYPAATTATHKIGRT